MVGFVQIFFIPFLLFHRSEWTDPVDIQPLLGTVMQRLVHYVSKWTNEKIGSENSKTTQKLHSISLNSVMLQSFTT